MALAEEDGWVVADRGGGGEGGQGGDDGEMLTLDEDPGNLGEEIEEERWDLQ